MSDEFDDLFGNSGKGPATARLSEIGDEAQGIIFKRQRLQEQDDDGNVVLNDWGKPKPLIVLWLATSLRSEEIEDDDGARRLWLKGNGLWVVQNFIRENSMAAPNFGGKIKVWVSGKKPNTNPKRKPMKLHDAIYADPRPEWKVIAQQYLDKWDKPKPTDDFDAAFAGESRAKPKAQENKSTLDSMRGFADDEPPF